MTQSGNGGINNYISCENNFEKNSNSKSVKLYGKQSINKPFISIVIPTYKRPCLLKFTIDSAINQTYKGNYEVIIVDNENIFNQQTDTEKLIEQYPEDKLQYYKNTDNLGMVGNWNRCIELANAEYITILHDDDWLEPNYLEEASVRISGDKALIFRVKYHDERYIINKGYKRVSAVLKDILHIITPKEHNISLYDFFIGHMAAGTLGVLYKKNILLKLGGFNERYYPGHDYILHINYNIIAGCIFFKKEIANYRISTNESMKIALKFPALMNNARNEITKSINCSPRLLKYLQSALYKINKNSINKFWNFDMEIKKNKTSNSIHISTKLIKVYVQIRNLILYV